MPASHRIRKERYSQIINYVICSFFEEKRQKCLLCILGQHRRADSFLNESMICRCPFSCLFSFDKQIQIVFCFFHDTRDWDIESVVTSANAANLRWGCVSGRWTQAPQLSRGPKLETDESQATLQLFNTCAVSYFC